MSRLLKKDQIPLLKRAKSKIIEVEEWGGSVNISKLTIRQKLLLQEKHLVKEEGTLETKSPEFMLDLVSLCVKDSNGDTIFDIDNTDNLECQEASVVEKLFIECVNYNWGSGTAEKKTAE